MRKELVFLDTETTGLKKSEGAEIVELAIVAENGRVLFDELLKPNNPIPAELTAIHGITNDDVKNCRSFDAVKDEVLDLLQDKEIVIYNASFDLQWFPEIDIDNVICAMCEYAEYNHEWDEVRETYRWIRLTNAQKAIGYDLPLGLRPHRALADCLITRAVYLHILKHK